MTPIAETIFQMNKPCSKLLEQATDFCAWLAEDDTEWYQECMEHASVQHELCVNRVPKCSRCKDGDSMAALRSGAYRIVDFSTQQWSCSACGREY